MTKKVLRVNFFGLVSQKEKKINRRLTHREIADGLGVTPHTVSKWMKGDVGQFTIDRLEAVMNYFECSLTDFLIEEEVPDGEPT